MSKQELMQNIINELNSENENRTYREESILDIPFMVSIIDQKIYKFEELMKDISIHNYHIQYIEDNTGGYTNGKIQILIEKPDDEKESDMMVDAYYNYHYEIEFLEDERSWGYCQCTEKDEGYNPTYRCCGSGCDWSAPRIAVIKVIDLGEVSWDGLERDYWKYKEDFNKSEDERNKEAVELEKKQKREYIEKEIERLKGRLVELG